MSSSSSASSTSRLAKEKFKRLIIDHNGDADHQDVKDALDELVRLGKEERNKKVRARRIKARTKSGEKNGEDSITDDATEVDNGRWSPAQSMEMNAGRWRAITTPPFPGKITSDDSSTDDGKSRFTLGRMSFNMFKPTKLVCALEDIINIIVQSMQLPRVIYYRVILSKVQGMHLGTSQHGHKHIIYKLPWKLKRRL